MLTFCYRKTESAAFIPHIDTLRTIIRTIRRADINVSYSQGYNPHMNLYMSPPLPLGTPSTSEYCTADTDISPKEFVERYNKTCLKGMECTAAYKVVKNPNIAAAAYSALYDIKSNYLKNNFQQIKDKNSFIITYISKGKEVSKDVINDILKIEKTDDGIKAVLRFGNGGNLRIDRFLSALGIQNDYEAVKTETYCSLGEKVYSAGEYIKMFGG